MAFLDNTHSQLRHDMTFLDYTHSITTWHS